MASLSIRGLDKSFGDTAVLHGIDLDVAHGEFVVFVGPSGCGKSTLLRCIAGLEDITAGELLIDGARMNDVPPAKRGIAMVFQSYALYPHMTVAENMSFGLRMAGTPKDKIDAAVREAAQVLQIAHLLERRPAALSGGQRQRVAIGRAIVRHPGVFLFDEPLSNLDAALRVQMRLEIARLHRELKTTILYVTHDQAEAMTLAQRIVVFNAGRIEQVGTPADLYERPANRFVAGFLGSPRINFIDGVVERDGLRLDEQCVLPLPAGLSQAGALVAAVRPEALRVLSDGSEGARILRARVQMVERLGDVNIVHALDARGTALAARTEPHVSLAIDDEVRLALPEQGCLLFDAEGRRVGDA